MDCQNIPFKYKWTPLSESTSAPFLALNYSSVFANSKNPKCTYTQGCKWSPDGSSLLVASNDRKFRRFNLPPNVANGEFNDENWIMGGWRKDIKPATTVSEADDIYDYHWYPQMKTSDPKSCCFAVTCHDMPIHLWNAQTGKLTCSYLYYNHLDTMVSAYSFNFTRDGSKLVAAYAKGIQVYDVTRPGRKSSTLASRGHFEIISSFAFHPDLPQIFAAGTYKNTVGLYSLRTGTEFAILEGHRKGVTHVSFSRDGTKLYSGTRKDDEIVCWDMRNPGAVLTVLKREKTTNQRIYFDVTSSGEEILFSGTTDGRVLGWNLTEAEAEGDNEVAPTWTFQAHDDCVNGVSIHPYRPLLASSCGQRVPPSLHGLTTTSDDGGLEEVDDVTKWEVSAKLWWMA